MLILRSIYNELKKEHEALQVKYAALQQALDGTQIAYSKAVDETQQLQEKCDILSKLISEQSIKNELFYELLDFIKAIEPTHAKGAAEMRKRRDALVAKVEAAMEGESEEKS